MEIAERLAKEFSGPIIFDYVWWVLRESEKKGIKRLYFLARDGYTLLRVAQRFCAEFNVDIELRYLPCSRTALRMPTYFFIGDEAFDLILLWGYSITLKSVLERAELCEEERKKVYKECNLEDVDEKRQLTKREYGDFARKLRQSVALQNYIYEKSITAYENAVGYFRQEGLFDTDEVAIVDSGWTGSMQRSLRQLLEFAGYDGKLIGFYFGMFEQPKAVCDGDYLTWFFDAEGKARDKAVFSNNLFECILSAPHGMTHHYQRRKDGYFPVYKLSQTDKEILRIKRQSDEIYKYCSEKITSIRFDEFDFDTLHRDTSKRIERFMSRPTADEVEYYGQFMFCDDITEAYQLSLVDRKKKDVLFSNSFILYRAIQKMTNSVPTDGVSNILWAYGTAAIQTKWKKWYRYNLYLWELGKSVVKSRTLKHEPMTRNDDYYKMITQYDIVSFDIFDTLIYRVINLPTDVFYLMGPYVKNKFGIADFKNMRISAEMKARAASPGREITLDEIYDEMSIDTEQKNILKDWEKHLEIHVLRGDKRMIEFMNYCHVCGKRVILISDMYQSKAFIEKVLRNCGIDNYDALYISSEEKQTKAKGDLFKKILFQERISEVRKWIHFGDNKHSDYIMPRSIGVQAVLYRNGRSTSMEVIHIQDYLKLFIAKVKNLHEIK